METVELLMKQDPPLKPDMLRWKPVEPTGNWKVECIDGKCTLLIGIKQTVNTSKSVDGKFLGIFNVKREELATIEVETFIAEHFLSVRTTTEVMTCSRQTMENTQ